MKKQERMQAAKAIVLAIAKNQVPDKEQDKALAKEKCHIKRMEDGRYYEFQDKDGKVYALVPTKKMVTAYDIEYYQEFRELDRALAACETKADVVKVQRKVEKMKAKSLQNMLQEGCDRLCVSLPDKAEKPKAETPKQERKKIERLPKEQQQEAVFNLMVELEGKVEFTQKKAAGSCVWVKGNVSAFKDELKKAGFVWSKKKQAYYWKPVAIVAA